MEIIPAMSGGKSFAHDQIELQLEKAGTLENYPDLDDDLSTSREQEENQFFHSSMIIYGAGVDEECTDDNVLNKDYWESCELNLDIYKYKDQWELESLASQLCIGGWRDGKSMDLSLARRLRDFQFAHCKRVLKYEKCKYWGIFRVYHHLLTVRNDIKWAEETALRRIRKESYMSWEKYDDIQKQKMSLRRPYFTSALILIFILMYVFSLGANGWTIEPLTSNPMVGPSRDVLLRLGAKDTGHIVDKREWWRLFTPIFLHAGLVHLANDIISLIFIGCALEYFHGSFFAAATFVLSGIGGNIVSALVLPHQVLAGASGGVSGMTAGVIFDIW
eukprot:CAMPEP_0194291568 /NCGR_PEP_ID=MMETSP0169-20130528/43653_1 /TAXON_ID=218684 /ORGANISM="Corethron pennatum, Strain L29A3" /LENGTH=331 /DNA_ID=CAMNT_0039039491 /DNA_START=139 /DNA_END=1131 /DNA_ORIENTATION=-